MNQLATTAVVLSRTDYGEADRIITVLTPDQGKLRLMARGSRRARSRLAGGIELFSVADITYIRGRGEIGTLISSRLLRHYGHIAEDINRTMLGYELIKQLHKATEDAAEADYFTLLDGVFAALDDSRLALDMVRAWFSAQLLRLAGHMPNVRQAADGSDLQEQQHYDFSFDDHAFALRETGAFAAADIKFLRLLFVSTPPILSRVLGYEQLAQNCLPLLQQLGRYSVDR